MIDEFNGMCDELFTTLLDSYRMTNWDMTWEEFFKRGRKRNNKFFQNS